MRWAVKVWHTRPGKSRNSKLETRKALRRPVWHGMPQVWHATSMECQSYTSCHRNTELSSTLLECHRSIVSSWLSWQQMHFGIAYSSSIRKRQFATNGMSQKSPNFYGFILSQRTRKRWILSQSLMVWYHTWVVINSERLKACDRTEKRHFWSVLRQNPPFCECGATGFVWCLQHFDLISSTNDDCGSILRCFTSSVYSCIDWLRRWQASLSLPPSSNYTYLRCCILMWHCTNRALWRLISKFIIGPPLDLLGGIPWVVSWWWITSWKLPARTDPITEFWIQYVGR